mmetsp:Transcript_15082/g.21669  ORF Transcript_15082/g.21669 Transcript_15082/m.21669 type:complete len:103 (-) Transcript_15082:1412-1720(-)
MQITEQATPTMRVAAVIQTSLIQTKCNAPPHVVRTITPEIPKGIYEALDQVSRHLNQITFAPLTRPAAVVPNDHGPPLSPPTIFLFLIAMSRLVPPCLTLVR